MNSFKRFVYLVFIIALLLLAGCGPTPEQIATQTSTAQTAVAALWTPTSTSTTTPTISPTKTPAPTNTSTPTLEASRATVEGDVTLFTIKDITFSIIVPEGWVKSNESADRVALYGPTIEGIPTVLTFSLDQGNMLGTPLEGDMFGISLYSAHVQDTISGLVQNPVSVSEDFYEPTGGEPYFRWIMEHNTNGKDFHQAFYIFGSGKWFLTVMYGRAKAGGNEMDAQVDETMKTLKFGG